jgi:hypothetical protein
MTFVHAQGRSSCRDARAHHDRDRRVQRDDDDRRVVITVLCDDSQALQSSVQDLKDVNVVENGTSSLQTAVTNVKDDAVTLVTAAKDEFTPEVDDLTSALSTLATSIGNIVSDGVQPVKDALSGVEDAATALTDKVDAEKCE